MLAPGRRGEAQGRRGLAYRQKDAVHKPGEALLSVFPAPRWHREVLRFHWMLRVFIGLESQRASACSRGYL